MMRAYLSCNIQPFLFCKPQHFNTVLGRTMAEMKAHACLLSQQDIPCHDHILHSVGDAFQPQFLRLFIGIHHAAFHHGDILTVCKDSKTFLFCQVHPFSVQGCIHNRLSVFADGVAPVFRHSPDICQFFSLLTDCDSAKLDHIGERFPLGALHHFFYLHAVIDHRFCVGHSTHSSHAAFYRRPASCRQCLLILQPRISEMYMQIDKTRHDVAPFCINDPLCFCLYPAVYSGNSVAIDQHITDFIPLCFRIQDTPLFD